MVRGVDGNLPNLGAWPCSLAACVLCPFIVALKMFPACLLCRAAIQSVASTTCPSSPLAAPARAQVAIRQAYLVQQPGMESMQMHKHLPSSRYVFGARRKDHGWSKSYCGKGQNGYCGPKHWTKIRLGIVT